jgi:hypothetical protein
MLEKSIVKRGYYHALAVKEAFTEQGIAGIKSYALSLDDKSLAKKILMAGINAKEYVQDTARLALKRIKSLFDREELVMAEQQAAFSLKDWYLEKQKFVTDQARLAITQMKSTILNRDWIMEKMSLAWTRTRNVLEMGYNAIKRVGSALTKKELYTSIGTAAMSAIKSLSSIPVIGWILGLAAAGTAIGLGMKFMNYGDDVVSKPGYGDRTLVGPEGAIQLNNKDTVIAGTNLFGNDVMSEPNTKPEMFSTNTIKLEREPLTAPKEKESKTETESKSTKGDNNSNAAILNEIKSLLQQIASSPGVVELDGAMVGKVLTPLINTQNLTTSVKTQ